MTAGTFTNDAGSAYVLIVPPRMLLSASAGLDGLLEGLFELQQ